MTTPHSRDNERLTRGLDSDQRTNLGDLDEIDVALSAYTTPEPDSDALFAQLASYLPADVAHDWRYWLKLARAQFSLVDGVFWWVSGLLLALGILLIAAGGGMLAAIYALTSPLLAAAGTAYIFRPEAHSLREFEILSAVRPLQLLYARLLLILTCNITLALTLILLAWTQDVQIVLWRLLLIWLGPLIGLTGLALFMSLWRGALAGVIVPMVIWAGLLFVGWRETVTQTVEKDFFLDAFAVAIGQSDALLLASLLILLAGILAIWAAGRQAGEAFAT